MSILTYNGITLPYATVSSFNQEGVYDPKGGTDRYLTRITITVQSVINPAYMAAIAPDLLADIGSPDTQNPATIMSFIRATLLQPRKQLSYTHNSRELIPPLASANSNGGTNRNFVDAKNGPQPQYCNITNLTNATFVITYSIVGHYWEANTTTKDGGETVINKNVAYTPVLYNRWTEMVSLDQSLYSTRVRDGTYTIRSDNPQGKTVDELRQQMAGLSVPSGFVRTDSRFSVTADGLSLNYHIVDKEMFRLPPTPAYEADGSYTENTSKNTMYRTANVQVRLRGCKQIATTGNVQLGGNPALGPIGFASAGSNLFQANLVRAALGECYGKFKLNGVRLLNLAGASATAQLTSTEITVGMYDNTVQCSMNAMIFNEGEAINWGLNIPIMAAGVTTGAYAPQPSYNTRGSAQILLQAAAYYTASATSVELANNAAPIKNPTDAPLPTSSSLREDNLNVGGFATVVPGQGGNKGT